MRATFKMLMINEGDMNETELGMKIMRLRGIDND